MNNKIIYLAGVPGGGTSAFAGVLHHLGIDMGNCQATPGIRQYTTFEDRDLDRFTWSLVGVWPPLAALRLNFAAYYDHRKNREDRRARPMAFKASAALWVDLPSGLPEEYLCVRIIRDLGDSIDSNVASIERIRSMQGGPALTRIERMAASSIVAHAHQAARELNCVAEFRYEKLISDTHSVVSKIAEAAESMFELSSGALGGGLSKAIAFVKGYAPPPDRRR